MPELIEEALGCYSPKLKEPLQPPSSPPSTVCFFLLLWRTTKVPWSSPAKSTPSGHERRFSWLSSLFQLCSHPATSRAKVSGSCNFSFSLGLHFRTKWEDFFVSFSYWKCAFTLRKMCYNCSWTSWFCSVSINVITSSSFVIFHFREVSVQYKVNRPDIKLIENMNWCKIQKWWR